MNKHPHFLTKTTKEGIEYTDVIMKRHDNGDINIAGYDITESLPVCVGWNRDTGPVLKNIDKIKDQHESAGDFPNHIRPTIYTVSLL